MLVYILFIFGPWIGVIGTNRICDTPISIECVIPRDIPTLRIPQTVEDVNRLCPATSQYLNCLKDYADECGYENVHQHFSEDTYQSIKDLVRDVCQNDSRLHLDIVENIACISESQDQFENDCLENLLDKLEILKQFIHNKQQDGTYDEPRFSEKLWLRMNCVTQSLTVSCFSSQVSRRCGTAARDAVVEVVARSKGLKLVCPPVIGERINELLRILDLGMEEKRLLDEIMKKK
ncbi:unnamed protein product [Larinioides sclopetarius]|uniref:Secreted protein n=1 Tax=Larinioides sclopetarius TaxID=280406 RepID=A0AAV2BL68_9ARAC